MSIGDLNTSAVGGLRRAKSGGKYDLRNIAVYNPTLNNYTGDIGNPIIVLEKQINADNNKEKIEKFDKKSSYNPKAKRSNMYLSTRKFNYASSPSQNNLESFINSLNQDLEKELEEQLRNDDLTPKKNNEEKEKNKNDENMEQNLGPKSRVLRLNDESSKYLKKRKRYKNFLMNSKNPNIFIEAMKHY